jgi:broad specificity phosphatase PhoE
VKKVYLIRHALPAFPGGSKMCLGITDIPLGQQGLEQARSMAEKLPPVTAIYSSPLRRAIQTAQAIGVPVQILSGLREIYAGDWDGLTFAEIRQRYPELYAARGLDKTIPPPGSENEEAALLRFSGDLARAAAEAPGDFAVVAHGGIIAKFLQSLTGVWQKPDYTEVIQLYWNDGKFYK